MCLHCSSKNGSTVLLPTIGARCRVNASRKRPRLSTSQLAFSRHFHVSPRKNKSDRHTNIAQLPHHLQLWPFVIVTRPRLICRKICAATVSLEATMAITRSKTAKKHITASYRQSRTACGTKRKTHSQVKSSKPKPSVASKREKNTTSRTSHHKLLKLNNDGPHQSLQHRSGNNPAARAQQDNTEQHTTDTSGFFKLPLELRDMVYHEIWNTQEYPWVERFQRKSKIWIYYDEERLLRGKSPVWLLTNKQIFVEGMKQFELRSYIYIGPTRSLYSYAVSIKNPLVFATSGPLPPCTARWLHLQRMDFKQWGVGLKKDRNEFRFLKSDTHWIQRLAETLGGLNKVEKLTFQIDHPASTRRILDISTVKFDLSPLQSLVAACPRLKILIIDVKHTYAQPWSAAYTRLGNEITALAKNTLGVSMKVSTQETLRHERLFSVVHLMHTYEKQ